MFISYFNEFYLKKITKTYLFRFWKFQRDIVSEKRSWSDSTFQGRILFYLKPLRHSNNLPDRFYTIRSVRWERTSLLSSFSGLLNRQGRRYQVGIHLRLSVNKNLTHQIVLWVVILVQQKDILWDFMKKIARFKIIIFLIILWQDELHKHKNNTS